jgi:hypothetical protein
MHFWVWGILRSGPRLSKVEKHWLKTSFGFEVWMLVPICPMEVLLYFQMKSNCINYNYQTFPVICHTVVEVFGHRGVYMRIQVKAKRWSCPTTRYEGAWGERIYGSYSFLTSALDAGEGSASRPNRALPPGKRPPVPIGQQAEWALEPFWTQKSEETSFVCAGDRTL